MLKYLGLILLLCSASAEAMESAHIIYGCHLAADLSVLNRDIFQCREKIRRQQKVINKDKQVLQSCISRAMSLLKDWETGQCLENEALQAAFEKMTFNVFEPILTYNIKLNLEDVCSKEAMLRRIHGIFNKKKLCVSELNK